MSIGKGAEGQGGALRVTGITRARMRGGFIVTNFNVNKRRYKVDGSTFPSERATIMMQV